MIPFTVNLDEAAARFYRQVADMTGQRVETVLADSLFKLAGELSLEALSRRNQRRS